MNVMSWTRLLASALALACAICAAPAIAQDRVFVSGAGNDANACTLGAPCRTLQHAHDVVVAGGEIDVLDPAGYGPLRIGKSISVQGHGWASVSPVPTNGGAAILIATGPTDSVSLRGLVVDGMGAGGDGIDFLGSGSLSLHDSIIHNLTGTAVDINPPSSAVVTVSNMHIADCGNGVFVEPQSESITLNVTVSHVRIDRCSFGVSVIEPGTVTVSDSSIAQGGTAITNFAGGATLITVRNVVIVGNTTGISAQSGGTFRVSGSTITQNSTGIAGNGGQVTSFQDNILVNDTNGAFTGMKALQ